MTDSRPTTPPPGFAHPAAGTQRTFRALLDALAHPGTPYPLPAADGAPDGIALPLAAVLLTVLDEQSPVALLGEFDTDPITRWLAFHTGAPQAELARARFVVTRPADLPALDLLDWGTAEAPHESATVIVATDASDDGPTWTLTGPGVETAQPLHAPWAGADFTAQWERMHTEFPRGVDVFVVAGDTVVGLPRTARITVAEGS